MRVRVRLFARYREATGRDRIELDLPEGGTVESAWSAVAERHPELARYRPFTLFAVGNEYVAAEHRLRPDDELCLFPPVSGGAGGDTYRVVTAPLSPDAIAATIEEPGAVDTPLWDAISQGPDRSRMLRPEDVARAAVLMVTLPPGAALEDLTLLPAGGIL